MTMFQALLSLSVLLITCKAMQRVEDETFIGTREDGLCQGNHFLFLSTYVLGRQQDLTLTIAEINRTAVVDEVTYSDEPFRTYRIFNMVQNITYLQSKQNARLMGQNVLRITNGTVRINFAFQWEKTQLGSSLYGTGVGTVSSFPISYEKTLTTNGSHELQWHLTAWQPIDIKSLSLTKIEPYKEMDDATIKNMLNKLSTGQPTIKDNLITILNANYSNILAEKVRQDPTLKFDKVIHYEYYDYRLPFILDFNQTLMNSTLAQNGLYLLFSQVIIGDPDFQCGEPVPQYPDDPVFGGLQQFISNSLIKSVLKYALKHDKLNVILSQEFWQSRAFQFFMGDVHEVMPSTTKNISTMVQLKGGCTALDDPAFSFSTKSATAYDVKINFQCYINFNDNKTSLAGVDLVVNYAITPMLRPKRLDFILTSLNGNPSFEEKGGFKVEYLELAQFMVRETMALAQGGAVLGSDYKTVNRKYPGVWVKQNYLFLYDSSAKPSKHY